MFNEITRPATCPNCGGETLAQAQLGYVIWPIVGYNAFDEPVFSHNPSDMRGMEHDGYQCEACQWEAFDLP